MWLKIIYNMSFINDIVLTELEVCENADNFLQSSMWGEFKTCFGWEAKAFLVNWSSNETEEKYPLLVLCRKLAPRFSFAYVPWGPKLPLTFSVNEKAKAIAELSKKIKPYLTRNTVFIRFEPSWFYTENEELRIDNKKLLEEYVLAGLKHSAATVQAPDTVIVDLKPSCEGILTKMKSKWRYNVSLAEKKGVIVKTGGVEDIEIFYDLLKETAQRDGIAVHGINYYRTLFELCEKENDVKIRLYTAKHDNDILASIIVLFRGNDATYLYGASSNNKRNLMAPYALQWKAMLDAKEAGCLNYDLFGIPPNENPNHPMAGLYRFKTGFGGQIIHRPGTWDFRYKPFFYFLFNMAERLRKKLRDLKKKRKINK